MTTGEITTKALKALEARNVVAWRQNDSFRRKGRSFIGKKGLSDIIWYCKVTGIFVACEVKNVGDILSDSQKEFLRDVKRNKGFALVAWPAEDGLIYLEEVEQYLIMKGK